MFTNKQLRAVAWRLPEVGGWALMRLQSDGRARLQQQQPVTTLGLNLCLGYDVVLGGMGRARAMTRAKARVRVRAYSAKLSITHSL